VVVPTPLAYRMHPYASEGTSTKYHHLNGSGFQKEIYPRLWLITRISVPVRLVCLVNHQQTFTHTEVSATESAKERVTYCLLFLRCIHFSFTYGTCITQSGGCLRPCRSRLMNTLNTGVHAFAHVCWHHHMCYQHPVQSTAPVHQSLDGVRVRSFSEVC
jgi:hypothetical protein